MRPMSSNVTLNVTSSVLDIKNEEYLLAICYAIVITHSLQFDDSVIPPLAWGTLLEKQNLSLLRYISNELNVHLGHDRTRIVGSI